jgi:hypothetical protein
MKKHITCMLLMSTAGVCMAQSGVSSGGSDFSSTELQLSATIGQPAYSTHTSTDIIVTEGIQQVSLDVVSGQKSVNNLSLKVYPNPATHELRISSEAEWEFAVTNSAGVTVKNGKVKPDVVIDFHSMNSGTYTVLFTNTQESQSFNIIKQ